MCKRTVSVSIHLQREQRRESTGSCPYAIITFSTVNSRTEVCFSTGHSLATWPRIMFWWKSLATSRSNSTGVKFDSISLPHRVFSDYVESVHVCPPSQTLLLTLVISDRHVQSIILVWSLAVLSERSSSELLSADPRNTDGRHHCPNANQRAYWKSLHSITAICILSICPEMWPAVPFPPDLLCSPVTHQPSSARSPLSSSPSAQRPPDDQQSSRWPCVCS